MDENIKSRVYDFYEWISWISFFFHSNSTIAKLSEEIEFYGDIYFKSRTLNCLVFIFFEFLALTCILVIWLAKNMPKTNLTCTAHRLANLNEYHRPIVSFIISCWAFFGNPHFIWNKKNKQNVFLLLEWNRIVVYLVIWPTQLTLIECIRNASLK